MIGEEGCGVSCDEADVFERTIEENDGLGLTTSRLSKYQTILWHSRSFILEPGEQDAPIRDRLMRLRPDISSVDDLVALYEASIAYKLGAAATAAGEPLAVPTLRVALGLSDTPDDTAYCARLLEKTG